MQKGEQLKKGQKAAFLIGVVIGISASIKTLVGFLTGSIVLLSDALHSGSDLISVFASWLGLKIAQRKPDEKFPYGYYKAENLATSLISLLIIWAGIEFLQQGYAGLFTISSLKFVPLALLVAASSALTDFFSSRYLKKIGEEINSQSLLATAADKKTDILSSTVVFLAVALTYFEIPYVEGLVTIVISLLILRIGLRGIKDSIFSLMDVSPGEGMENKVAEAIESVAGIEGFYDLRLRKAGPFVFGETKVGIRKFVDVKRAHEIADKIEDKIKAKVSQIDSFIVHIEPFKSEFKHLVIPVVSEEGLNSPIAKQFARAPYFLFVNLEGKKIKGSYFLKNFYKNKKVRAGLAVAKLIAKQKSEFLITSEVGEIAFHALRDNLVDVYRTKSKTAKGAIRFLIKNRLEQLSQPTKRKD